MKKGGCLVHIYIGISEGLAEEEEKSVFALFVERNWSGDCSTCFMVPWERN